MALDWPAFGDALWRVSDQTGIRPEWILPVLSLETGGTFDPAIMNAGGCVGLNQFCPAAYPRYVTVPVDAYRRWSASRQLSGPILEYWRDAIQSFGPIRSATKLMVAQLGHGLLKRASGIDSVIFTNPSAEYLANASLDRVRKGTITVQDLASALGFHARSDGVQDALARVYALRPGEKAHDAVYGTDFGFRGEPIEILRPPVQAGSRIGPVVGLVALVAGGYGLYRIKRRRRVAA